MDDCSRSVNTARLLYGLASLANVNKYSCLEHLIPLLPSDLEDIYNASANKTLGVDDYMGFYDGRTHKLLGIVGGLEKNDPGYNICAARGRFREILSQHLDIQFKKQFKKYQVDKRGIIAYFNDGETARGDILVAADGARSAVRSQLLPGFQSTPSTYVAIHGNITLSKLEYSPIVGTGHTTGVVMADKGLKFYMVLLEYNADGTAVFNWNCSFQSEDSQADYEWTQTATQDSLHDQVLRLIQHFPPFVVDPIKAAGPSCVHQPPVGLFETVLPLGELPQGPVTLIGDSAHSMVREDTNICHLSPLTLLRRFLSEAWAPILPSLMPVILEEL